MRDKNGKFIKKYYFNEDFFTVKNKKFYYLLGLLSSDGNVKNDRVFSISQSGKKGKKLVEFILKMLNSDYPIYEHEKTNSYSITMTSPKVVSVLNEYNIFPNKTLVFKLSDNIPCDMMKYFIQGYIDGDGSVGTYDNGGGVMSLTVSIVGTELFIKQLYDILKTKGNVRKIKKCNNLFEIRFYGKKSLDLYYEIYDDVVYKSYKYYNFINFIENDSVGMKYKKYYHIKDEIISKINNGVKIPQLSKEYQIPIKTLYTWKYRTS